MAYLELLLACLGEKDRHALLHSFIFTTRVVLITLGITIPEEDVEDLAEAA